MQFYKDEFEKTQQLSQAVLGSIRQFDLPATPEMYELWYVYHGQINPDVVREIKMLSAKPTMVTIDSCLTVYAQYLSPDRSEAAVRRAGEQIQETIREVNEAVSGVQTRTEDYGKNLRKTMQVVQGTEDPQAIRNVVQGLVQDTEVMLESSSKLHTELDKSAQIIKELQRDLEIVRREAMTDGLTGLANRKCFDGEIQRAMINAREKGAPFTLLMVDIDHFKSFNDNFGHQVGDQVLRLVGRTLIEGIKGRDFAARYGGEEFAIILPESNVAAGMAVGNALRKALAMKDVVNRNTGEKLGRITMSVGVAEYVQGEGPEDMIERTDGALYTAKHNGRNQVAAAPAPIRRSGS
jgi:diguanylate cyclase